MAEGNGKGRGRAVMFARLRGQEDEPKELPSIGRGALLRNISVAADRPQSDDPSPPPSEARPKGRGALMQSFVSSISDTRSVASSSSQFEPAETASRTSESVAASSVSEPPSVPPTGGRGRAALLQLISQKTEEVTEGIAKVVIEDRSPPRSRRESGDKPPPVKKPGHSGRKIEATANFIELELMDPDQGIYEYEVNFAPGVDATRERVILVNEVFRKYGGNKKIFDGGALLFSPTKLDKEFIRDKSQLRSGMEVEVIIKYKRVKNFNDCRQILNIIFKRIMSELHLVKFGRSDYNPQKMIKIQQHKLSIWPGCVTAIDEYEGGIKLCLDASHRVLRDQTCLEMIREIIEMHKKGARGDGVSLKEAIQAAFIGASVITTYNNKVYKVDDVDFEVNPLSKFDKAGVPTSYISYYKDQYNLNLTDHSQPLLVHRIKRKPVGKENIDLLLYLVPELCCPTGLTDDMRNDFKLMRDVAVYTRCSPNERQKALGEFVQGIRENERAIAHLNDWGLKLPGTTVNLTGRVLDPETIYFGNKRTVQEPSADWNRALGNNAVLSPIDLKNWAVIHVARDTKYIQQFLDMVRKTAPTIGMKILKPQIKCISSDHARLYCEEIRQLAKENVQVVVPVFPTMRDDRYSTVKKLCNADLGIASQVINSKTLSKPNALKSIVTKIVLQINCKVGGTLWGLSLPYKEEGIMFCGIDAYHEALKKTQSVLALVSSLNSSSTRWTSGSAFHNRGQEISDVITGLLKENLQQWFKANGGFPKRIVVFRDGVGDGQLKTVRDFEVPQFERMFSLVSADYKPMLTYIIVQKRISARIYAKSGNQFSNPPPGTIIDHTITRRNWYDFFLVSQNVRQGTVSPSHYVVVKDSSDMTPDQVQRLSYKMTHLYYNWSGTVRVPAPCQYAHKLAYLIGQHVHAKPKENLRDLLYFL